MNGVNVIEDITRRTNILKQSYGNLDREVLSSGAWLERLMTEADSINTRLGELHLQKPVAPPKPAQPAASSISEGSISAANNVAADRENFEKNLEKLLQGSLDALGDKISDKILNMLKELKGMAGPGRDIKVKEIKAAADSQLVDLSSLFMHEKVESNIEEIGVDEKEAKGVDKSLEKLRQMRKKQ